MKRIIWFILFLMPLYLTAKPLEVLYIWHTTKEQPFTKITNEFAKAVAKDLNINLKSVYPSKEETSNYGNMNRFSYEEFAKKYFLDTQYKPDVIISVLFRKTGRHILEFSHSSRIPLFIVNTNISQEDEAFVKNPREVYPYFLGLVASNEIQAGKLLLNTLVSQAKRNKPNKTIEVLGISGPREAIEAHHRNEGLYQAIQQQNNTHMHQVVYANWDKQKAYELTKKLLRRHNNGIDVIWAASDSMALGAKQAVKEAGIDVIIGGIDWSKEGIENVKNGQLQASVGGHFLNGGIALILLHDYFKGIDFKNELSSKVNLDMFALTPYNMQEYKNSFSSKNWEKIDFKNYSKVYNKSLKSYTFSLENFISK